jgi:hypothetical protein|tara:strand:+ start:11070 stop:11828 length:759 start_codon:yes stop_codon:yes gene_type:complete
MKKKSPYVSKVYKLTGRKSPLSYMLSSRHSSRSPLLYFDEEKGINRPMRYARNQKSPFEDEQDGNAILEPIVFEDGMLLVQKENQVLQEFLHYHPANGSVFSEVNKEQDAIDELHEVENVLEAQVMAKELASNTQKMIQVCRVLLGNVVDNMTIPELKRDLLIYSKNNPEDFINTINDPMLQLQDDVYQFFKAGFLQKRNNDKEIYYNLPNNKKRLLSVPFGEDPDWIVASYFQSDDGVDVYKILKNRLKKS